MKRILAILILASLLASACSTKTACGSKSKKGQSKKVNKFMGYKR